MQAIGWCIYRLLPNVETQVPVTVVAGAADRLLPSPEEAKRLAKLIPCCRTRILEGCGHAPLFDTRTVRLSEIIASDPAMEGVVLPQGRQDEKRGNLDDKIGRTKASAVFSKDWVEDFVEPDEATVEEGRKTIDFLFKRWVRNKRGLQLTTYSSLTTRTTLPIDLKWLVELFPVHPSVRPRLLHFTVRIISLVYQVSRCSHNQHRRSHLRPPHRLDSDRGRQSGFLDTMDRYATCC